MNLSNIYYFNFKKHSGDTILTYKIMIFMEYKILTREINLVWTQSSNDTSLNFSKHVSITLRIIQNSPLSSRCVHREKFEESKEIRELARK